jgi:ATP-dependent Clp protease adaptor protein ClpS
MTFRLTIHDDADHTFDYVIRLLSPVLGVSHREAFDLAWKIHDEGRAHVGFLQLETARQVEELLLSGGPDRRLARSETSLTISLEEVTGDTVTVRSRGRVGPKGYERLEDAEVAALHADSTVLYGRCRDRARDAMGVAAFLRVLFTVTLIFGAVLFLLVQSRLR